MSELEERISAILKLRLKGHTEFEIAENLNLSVTEIRDVEELAKKRIVDSIVEGPVHFRLEEISNETNLPAFVVSILSSHYNVNLYGLYGNRLSSQQRLEAIEFAVEEGAISSQIIGKMIGLSTGTVIVYSRGAGIDLPSVGKGNRIAKGKKTLEERVQAIKQAIQEGLYSVEAVADRVGLSPFTTFNYISTKKIHVPENFTYKGKIYRPRHTLNETKLKIIQKALSESVKSLEELCKRTRLGPPSLRVFCDQKNIVLPLDLIPYRYKPPMDAAIDRGESLHEIGIAGGYPAKSARENARQYILNSGQYNLWKAAKQKIKNAHNEEIQKRQELHRQLITILKGRVSQLTQNESWPVQMALKCSMSESWGVRTPFEVFVRLFEIYEAAQKSGTKIAYKKLGEQVGLSTIYVGDIFRKLGIRSLFWNIEYQPKNRYQNRKNLVKRVYDLGISIGDVAYFLDLTPIVIRGHLNKINANIHPVTNTYITGIQNLSCRLASQIYEAQDLGFNRSEIAELFDTKEKIVEFAIENRREIGRTIIDVLRIAYNDRKYNKPYKTQIRS